MRFADGLISREIFDSVSKQVFVGGGHSISPTCHKIRCGEKEEEIFNDGFDNVKVGEKIDDSFSTNLSLSNSFRDFSFKSTDIEDILHHEIEDPTTELKWINKVIFLQRRQSMIFAELLVEGVF